MSMGSVFQWYSSNTHIDFPFVGRDMLPAGLNELFVDAAVVHNSKQLEVELTNFNPAGDVTLKFSDGTTLCAFTVADGFQSRTWGPWTLLQWQKQTVTALNLTDSEIIVRFVLLTSKLADFAFPVTPTDAWLQPALVVNREARVRRIIGGFAGIPLDGSEVQVEGLVPFEAEYNMKIDVVRETQITGLQLPTPAVPRPKTRIIFNAVPGAGWGMNNDCAGPEDIKLINGIAPDAAGNFQLEAVDCYWISQVLAGPRSWPIRPGTDYQATPTANTLQLHGDCKACCDCAAYGSVYENIIRIWQKAKRASQRIERARQRYAELRAFLLATKAAREVGLKVFLRTVPRPDFSLSLQLTVSNNSAADITSPVTISCELSYDPDILESSYIPRSSRLDIEEGHNLQINPTKAGETYSVTVPYLRAARYAIFSLDIRCKKKTVSATLRQNVVVRAVATATHGSSSASDAAWCTLEPPIEKE